uniref:Cilia-and flagella-associated protein 96 n=1 Tax=Arion vulgaris TaxID=1028688 RepID=A0A0B6ZX50_9EUPU
MGDKGGRNDMDRMGLFQEMTYITIGDQYTTPGQRTFNESAGKGKQMLPGGLKEKSAKQDGYFDEKFSRVMEGEAYSDPVKLRRQQKIASSKKNLSKAFMPTSGNRTMNGLGTFYGTIGSAVASFSPTVRDTGAKVKPLKNLFTNPGKKGTGYGYANVGLNLYPPHSADDYNKGHELQTRELAQHKSALKGGVFHLNMYPASQFNLNPYTNDRPLPPPNKWAGDGPQKTIPTPFRPSNPGKQLGGMKAGTFDPYPAYSADTYGIKYKRPVNVVNKTGRTFVPPQGPKSTPCQSIVNQNVMRSVNVQNYRSISVL